MLSIQAPESLTFVYNGSTVTITRAHDFCDITELRKNAVMNFSNFKKTQIEFLDDVKKETKEDTLIKRGRGNTTLIHEKILERILRWYGVDEENVIDRFVKPDTRIIGHYQYSKISVLCHLKNKYINASKFAHVLEKNISDWKRLDTTQALFKLYYLQELKLDPANMNDYIDAVIKRGLGYDYSDIWIPQELLPMLATWCSPDYALFASKLLMMFHQDPLKMAGVAIKEYDKQTGQHTVAVLHSTDSIDEHNRIVELLERKIATLTSSVHRITYDKSLLEIDNKSLIEQAQPFFALRDTHGIDFNDIVKTSTLLDRFVLTHDEKMSEQLDEIKALKKTLKESERALERMTNQLDAAEETYDDQIVELHGIIDELATGKCKSKIVSVRKKKKLAPPKIVNKPVATGAVYMFTKKTHICTSIKIASNDVERDGFKYKGVIIFSSPVVIEETINSYIKNTNYTCNGCVISAEPSVTTSTVELGYCKHHAGIISNKKTKYGYNVSLNDSICDY